MIEKDDHVKLTKLKGKVNFVVNLQSSQNKKTRKENNILLHHTLGLGYDLAKQKNETH